MKLRVLAFMVLALCAQQRVAAQSVDSLFPRGDHHTHLASRDDSAYLGGDGRVRTAKDLVAALDSGHVEKALVLSTAYWFGAPDSKPDPNHDEYTRVRAENDWVAAQVAQYPARLVGFCAVNPLRDYALREIARCKSIGLRGLKLHLANSRVDFDSPDDVAKTRAAFAAANAARLPIVVHLRGSPRYGAREARIFIEQILSAAPDVPVQLAHLAGWGSYDQGNDDALAFFIVEMKLGLLDGSHLYFDISSVYTVVEGDRKFGPAVSPWTPVIAQRIRQIGLDHVLFGTDTPSDASESAMAEFLVSQSGLSREEVRQIFENVAPYLK